MKQQYRIGAHLEESKLKISIMKGYRNISNIEFLVYDLDLLLIQLQKLWAFCNISIIKYERLYNKLKFIY